MWKFTLTNNKAIIAGIISIHEAISKGSNPTYDQISHYFKDHD